MKINEDKLIETAPKLLKEIKALCEMKKFALEWPCTTNSFLRQIEAITYEGVSREECREWASRIEDAIIGVDDLIKAIGYFSGARTLLYRLEEEIKKLKKEPKAETMVNWTSTLKGDITTTLVKINKAQEEFNRAFTAPEERTDPKTGDVYGDLNP